MSRILVASPYALCLDPHEAGEGRPYPPLAGLVAAAELRRRGHDVRAFDPMFVGPDERAVLTAFDAALDQAPLDAVAVYGDDHSVAMKQCLGAVRRVQRNMAAAAARRGLPVISSGPDVSDHAAETVAAGASAATVGDNVLALAEWVEGGAAVPGVVGLRGAGGRRAVVSDLDALPVAARDLVDLSAYARAWRQRHGTWELNVWTARGCPYRCNWCAKPTWGRTYQVRSAASVAAEIQALKDGPAPDRLWFTDDIFGLRPAWLRELRERLDAPLPHRCLSRADLLQDARVVADLAGTGCDQVWLGAESGSDHVLSLMDKDTKVAEIERSVGLLRDHGIGVGLFLQLGYPGETVVEVRQTAALVARLRPDWIGVSVSYPLPGTPFHAAVVERGHDPHWDGSMENRPLFDTPYAGAFYDVAKEVLRSTHSVARGPAMVRAFLRAPDRRSARRVVGAAWHSVRLPVVRRRMEALATDPPPVG
jgi:anaerobic magnesium-protoporphyrin IX monomethyl ester cyclase